jgi:nicotinamide-nucleotide amidase
MIMQGADIMKMRSVANRFIKELKEKDLTVCFGESVTCGEIVSRLSGVKDLMDVLTGALVCYHPSCKKTALKISESLIKKCTPESMEVTRAIVKGLPRLFNSDICAGITGLAAPGGSESPSKPVGTVFFAVRYKRKIYDQCKRFRGSPREIREKAADEMLRFILLTVKKVHAGKHN